MVWIREIIYNHFIMKFNWRPWARAVVLVVLAPIIIPFHLWGLFAYRQKGGWGNWVIPIVFLEPEAHLEWYVCSFIMERWIRPRASWAWVLYTPWFFFDSGVEDWPWLYWAGAPAGLKTLVCAYIVLFHLEGEILPTPTKLFVIFIFALARSEYPLHLIFPYIPLLYFDFFGPEGYGGGGWRGGEGESTAPPIDSFQEALRRMGLDRARLVFVVPDHHHVRDAGNETTSRGGPGPLTLGMDDGALTADEVARPEPIEPTPS